jgi:RIO kinase 1
MSSNTGLQQLVDEGVIDDVLQQIKSGKEADVFLVRKGETLLAAKVYKARNERNFKNNAGYLEGRNTRSSRDARAMAKGSRYGRDKAEQAWKSAEVDALYKLHAAGVRVPTPDIFYEGVLLMSLVIDAEGNAAPRMSDVQLTAEQAATLYPELLRQVTIMLSCDLIHGDLSAFNILLAHDGPTVIDLPQVISAAANPQAEMFFRRDVRNLHQFLAQFAPALTLHPDGGADIWKRYSKTELFAGYVPDLASLKDDTPVPTFKAKQTQRGPRRPRGPNPQVVYKGQAPAPASASPERAPQEPPPQRQAQQPRPHAHPGSQRHAPPQHSAPRSPGQQGPAHAGGQRHAQPPHSAPRPPGQQGPAHAGGQRHAQSQHTAPRPQGPQAQHPPRPQHARPAPRQQPQQQHPNQPRPPRTPGTPRAPQAAGSPPIHAAAVHPHPRPAHASGAPQPTPGGAPHPGGPSRRRRRRGPRRPPTPG